MLGYVNRLATRRNVPDLDLPSWLTVLRKAHAMRPMASLTQNGLAPKLVRRASPPPSRTDTVFGKDGNALGLRWIRLVRPGKRLHLVDRGPQPADDRQSRRRG